MTPELWIVLLSSVIPLATLVYTVVGLKHKGDLDYIQRLEVRIAACEKDRERLVEMLREQRSRRPPRRRTQR